MKDQEVQVPLNEETSKKLVQEFVHLFSALQRKRDDYPVHPSDRVLDAYVERALPDVWVRPDVEDAHTESWNLSQVSFHVATCKQCDRAVKKLRCPKRKTSRFEEYFCAFGITGQRGRIWAFSYATSVALLFAMMINVNLTLDHRDPLRDLYLATVQTDLRQELASVPMYQGGGWKVAPFGLQVGGYAVQPAAATINQLRQRQLEKKVLLKAVEGSAGVMP